MIRHRILACALLVCAAPVAARETPTASRQSYLLRDLDRRSLNISIAVAMLDDPFPEVRARAVQVVASTADASQVQLLARYLNDGDPRVRRNVMLAAGRMGEPGLPLALHGLKDATPAVRQAAAWAACHGGSNAFEGLARLLQSERSRPVLESLLSNLWRFDELPWQRVASVYAESSDVFLRRAAAYSLSRTGAESARKAQRKLVTDGEPVIRATALRGFERGSLVETDLTVVLPALSDRDWRVRAAACRVLAVQNPVHVPPAMARAVVEAFASRLPHLAVSAIAAAAAQPGIGTTGDLRAVVGGGQPWLAAEALAALSRRDKAGAAEIAMKWLRSDELWRRRAAARVAADSGAGLEKLAAADEDAAVRLAWLESLDREKGQVRRARLLEVVSSDPDPAVRSQALSLLRSIDAAPGVEKLVGLYASWGRDEMPDARAEAIVAALAAASKEERPGILKLGLDDPDPTVVAMVVNAARGLGIEVALPAREPRHGRRFFEDLPGWAAVPRWLDVETDRGTFRIRLDLETTPLTSREIWDLAVDGYYDGLGFHRVVPNFVIQGGDPRGDGWGGPGFSIPDEPSLVPFDSWRVGVATSGPQTGGSQLFVTLTPADHLTGHYTNFGEVVAGREVLNEIRVGDRIHAIRTHSGDNLPPLPPTRPFKKYGQSGQGSGQPE